MTYEAMTPQCGKSVVQVLVGTVDIGVVTYEAMTPQNWRSVVQILVIRVDIGVVTCETMTSIVGGQWFRSWFIVDIGVVIYEAMTPPPPQCGRSVVQVLVVRGDIGVVTYEAMIPQVGRSVGLVSE